MILIGRYSAKQWAVRLLLIVAILAFATLAARAYHSEHLFTRAESGRKTLTDYQQLLSSAWNTNHHNSASALRYAQFLQTRGRLADSRQVLLESGTGRSHWQGWEIEAVAWERFAFSDAGTIDDAKQAAQLLDQIIKVHPSYERGLERRGLLALKLGEWTVVENVADRLLAYNAANKNAVYFRARMAEGLGDTERARDAYSKLSAAGEPDADALYTQAELLTRLKPAGGGRQQ